MRLGEEAAAVVRQAASLAGWRGHAQVTPLHIASAMLWVSPAAASILRAACCDRSQPYPALDLRLGVALDRLPTPKLARPASAAAHDADRVEPAPSNAFVAALKRAQVGGKVELEQLVRSILVDPSVDRVMRAAAGFSSSSSQVRASVEGATVSPEQLSRASADVAPSLSPVPKKATAGGQPSLQSSNRPGTPPAGRRRRCPGRKVAY